MEKVLPKRFHLIGNTIVAFSPTDSSVAQWYSIWPSCSNV